ncbi:hypothetical protein BAMA_16225 [Bacillus manliponensis]|uniref:Uncharacterized protein n=1 Tax=Bacillus manliponensis TaxID=574376 RepID=A0A073JQ77_9BACI|nr:hypothetical protein [Bacillus manliponensis]KEK17239.1 hypothetical protein BAMA_16225 [Bacillus manliponensis]
MSHIFNNDNWCDVCSKTIAADDLRNMYIEGSEKALCKSCRGDLEMKVVDMFVIQDMLKCLIKEYGPSKVREFDLSKAEALVTEKQIELQIEKRGGEFNQQKLGEFVFLKTSEIITIIQILKRKIGSELWMNPVIKMLLEKKITITLSQEGESNDRANNIFA